MSHPQNKNEAMNPLGFANLLMDLVSAEKAPWQKPWSKGGLKNPFNPVSHFQFRGVNKVILMASEWKDPRWVSLKQARDKGYRLRPDQVGKGTPIEFWVWTEQLPLTDSRGQIIVDDKGLPKTTEIKLAKPVLRIYTVYNIAQFVKATEDLAEDFDNIAYEKHNVYERAKRLVLATGAEIRFDVKNQACYDPVTDIIHMPNWQGENIDRAMFYPTLFHELAHWTSHHDRLNRNMGRPGSQEAAREEMRAEISAFMISIDLNLAFDPIKEHNGYDCSTHSAFIKAWKSKFSNPHFELVKATREAEKIKNFIMKFDQGLLPVPENSRNDKSQSGGHDEKEPSLSAPKMGIPQIRYVSSFPDMPTLKILAARKKEYPFCDLANMICDNLSGVDSYRYAFFKWEMLLMEADVCKGLVNKERSDFAEFLTTVKRIASTQLYLAKTPATRQDLRPSREEFNLLNGILGVIEAGRKLGFEGFIFSPPAENEHRYMALSVIEAEREKEPKPIELFLDNKITKDYVQCDPKMRGAIHIVVDSRNIRQVIAGRTRDGLGDTHVSVLDTEVKKEPERVNLIMAITLTWIQAQNMAKSLNSPEIKYLPMVVPYWEQVLDARYARQEKSQIGLDGELTKEEKESLKLAKEICNRGWRAKDSKILKSPVIENHGSHGHKPWDGQSAEDKNLQDNPVKVNEIAEAMARKIKEQLVKGTLSREAVSLLLKENSSLSEDSGQDDCLGMSM